MVPGDNFIGVGFCLSSGELIYMFNIFMYICLCICIICNTHVHGACLYVGKIPADPSMIHYGTIDGQLGGQISI